MASGGTDKNVKIFDKRESKIVKTFKGIHRGNIYNSFNKIIPNPLNYYFLDMIACVKWSPSGDMLASVGNDDKVALLDFKTGKILYTGRTLDGSNFS